MKAILVTGSAGFIGSNLVLRLFKEMQEGTIVGLDNLNDYYDPTLKDYRLSEIEKAKPAGIEYEFVKGDLADKALIDGLFEKYHFDVVVNLAAQAGVRYSITNPDAYIQSNMIGFYNILEACRHSMDEVRCKKEDVNAQPSAINHQTYRGVECMQLPRRATSCLPTAIQSCMISPQQVCAFLQYMALQVVLIWRTSALPTNY